MWTFTAYIIHKLSEAKGTRTIHLTELSHFIFDILWKKYNIVLNNSSEELEREVEYLKEVDAVDFDGVEIRVKDKLERIARVVERSALKDILTFYKTWLEKIDTAIMNYVGEIA